MLCSRIEANDSAWVSEGKVSSLKTFKAIMKVAVVFIKRFECAVIIALLLACCAGRCDGAADDIAVAYGVKHGRYLYWADRGVQGDILKRVGVKTCSALDPDVTYHSFDRHPLENMSSDYTHDTRPVHGVLWDICDGFVWHADIQLFRGGGGAQEAMIERADLTEMDFEDHVAATFTGTRPNPPLQRWGAISPGTAIFHINDLVRWPAVQYSKTFGWPIRCRPLHSPLSAAAFDIFPIGPRELVVCIAASKEQTKHYLRLEKVAESRVFTFRCVLDVTSVRMFGTEAIGWRSTWTRSGSVRSSFVEQFRLTVIGDKYYFITENGKLYEATAIDGDGQAEMKLLCPGPSHPQPVIALLRDADNNKSYVFSESGYLELQDPVRPHTVPVLKVALARTSDPMERLLHCAEALASAGVISIRDGK